MGQRKDAPAKTPPAGCTQAAAAAATRKIESLPPTMTRSESAKRAGKARAAKAANKHVPARAVNRTAQVFNMLRNAAANPDHPKQPPCGAHVAGNRARGVFEHGAIHRHVHLAGQAAAFGFTHD
jgi:hypothetical protein